MAKPDEADLQRLTDTDFSDALVRAEQLLERVQRATIQLRVLSTVELALAGTAVALVLAAFADLHSARVVAPALAGAVVSAGVALRLRASVRGPLAKVAARDLATMVVLVDRLREILPFLARREQWSQTRFGLAQQRIARFPVGGRQPW